MNQNLASKIKSANPKAQKSLTGKWSYTDSFRQSDGAHSSGLEYGLVPKDLGSPWKSALAHKISKIRLPKHPRLVPAYDSHTLCKIHIIRARVSDENWQLWRQKTDTTDEKQKKTKKKTFFSSYYNLFIGFLFWRYRISNLAVSMSSWHYPGFKLFQPIDTTFFQLQKIWSKIFCKKSDLDLGVFLFRGLLLPICPKPSTYSELGCESESGFKN